jgi:hypothetical protein
MSNSIGIYSTGEMKKNEVDKSWQAIVYYTWEFYQLSWPGQVDWMLPHKEKFSSKFEPVQSWWELMKFHESWRVFMDKCKQELPNTNSNQQAGKSKISKKI